LKTPTAKRPSVHWDNLIPGVVALIAGLTMLYSSFAAGAPADANHASDGGALLAQAVGALRSAKTLTADFAEEDSYPTSYKDLAQRGKVEISRPGSLRIEVKRFRRVTSADPWRPSGNNAISVSDGATYTYAFLHPHSTLVRREPSSPSALRRALEPAATIQAFFDDPRDPTAGQASGPVALRPQALWEGHVYAVVEYPVGTRDQNYDAYAYIGDDHIVHRLIYQAKTLEGVVTKEWTLRNVRLNSPVPAAAFAYTPPADAAPLVSNRGGTALAVGTVAPDFAVTDIHGKPIRLSDFRGKTVILDFWATWCWPCNQSLPGTNTLVHANKDKGVVALAVAIWDSKKGFDVWTHKHSYSDLRFAFDPSKQGEGPSALYKVSATPTAYVIGPDGRIAGAQLGFSGSHTELEAAVRSATGSASVAGR